jgi:hypothetical protein
LATFRYSAVPSGWRAGPAAVAAPPATAVPARDWGRLCLQAAPIVAVSFAAKLSLPPLGVLGLGLDVPLIVAATFIGLASGLLHVHRTRLVMYLVMLAWLGGSQLVSGQAFSWLSLVLLATLFLPLTLQLRPPDTVAAPAARGQPVTQALQTLSSLAQFFAACGVLQFVLQPLLGVAAAFPIDHGLPQIFLIQAFNPLIPVSIGDTTLKANGVFFLEPSFFSQFVALGLLTELSLRNRMPRVALLVAGLAVSYSGTGLVVAAVGGLALVAVKGRWDLLLLGALVLLVLVLLGDHSPLAPMMRRASEFESTRSSGSARFIAWIDMFQRQWWPEPSRVLFGAGAGSFMPASAVARQPTAEMSFSKMLFEYGISGALLFFAFLVHAFNSVRAPLAFRMGLCATLLVNGAFVAFPVGIAASVLLWPPSAAPRRLFHRYRKPPP